ncbi:MAG: ribosomal protein L7/L12 [Planctomycetaceae bacterium]|nr:ribosomal protein L7/L12 [Planctomycetaceae bacterium]
MHFRGLFLGGMIWLGAAWPCAAQTPNTQNGEQILPVDKAPAAAPLRRPESFPWYQLSNLRKGGTGRNLLPAEFSLQYVRDKEAANTYSIILVANGVNGRKDYSSWGPFSPFADKSGTVSAEASFSPFAKNLGDQFEIWLEAHLFFENKSYRFKVSNSAVVGNVGQPSLARHWTADEQKGIDRWQKSVTPPPPPPSGHVAISPDTKLLPGMPILAGWMAAWEPAEVIDVRKDGMVLVKYKPELSSALIVRQRNWLSVEATVLQTAKTDPAKFQPSVKVLPNGMLPVSDDLVPLENDTPLVKGTPLRMALGNKWAPVTVVKLLVDGRVRIRWDERKGHADEDKPRDGLVIEKETLTALKEPGAAEKFAARVNESTATFGGQTPQRQRQLKQYPIKLAIPTTAVKVTEETPLEEGTKLGCSWGSSWYDVSVIDVHDDGTVRIHWDKFGDAWDGDLSRDCLIIDKKVLAKLSKQTAKTAPKGEPATGASKSSADGGFQLVLNGYGKNRFAVIKVVMEITGLDIKDAKELVENTPIPLKQGIEKADAEKLRKKITDAGGTAEVKLP